MEEFIEKYKYPLIFACVGLLLGLLILTLGLFKIVIITILTVCGFYLGIYLETIGFFDK